MAVKNIVVLGGGFGGLRTALNLEKKLGRNPDYQITLIDQNTFHLYTASLYEVASGELSARCVLVPYAKIFHGKKIKFLNATATKLDPKKKIIETSSGEKIPYHKLVLALGSDTEDFGIPGVAENAIGLKSSVDAEQIYQHLLRCAVNKGAPIKVVVGGGGFTGVEVAGELTEHRKCPLAITIVEAAPRLLPGMPDKISQEVAKQLNFLGVRILTSSPIKEVKKQEVILVNGKRIPADLTIWTAGVRGSRFLNPEIFPLDKKKALLIDKNLRVKGFKDIFAVGDSASTGVGWTATKAEEDGRVVAHNIAEILQSAKPRLKPYKVFDPPLIVPAGKKWAIAKVGSFIASGPLAVALKKLVLLYYLVTILPLDKALKAWWSGESEVLQMRVPQQRTL
ncbi:MAG: FAD-dependent oxidoreductase [Patescibacteria group bacterium]